MNYKILDRRSIVLDPQGNPVPTGYTSAPEAGLSALSGSFQGAAASKDRGYVYLPTLETIREVDAWSHTELLKRGRFVYNSGGGFIHRCVNGIARQITGTGLFPYPLSKSKDWNKRLRRLWARQCESPNTFDLSRKFTCGAAQAAIVRSKIRDGDLAPVMARDPSGRLRVMFYEAHQIGNGRGSPGATPTSDRWFHGVKLDRWNAPTAYRILSRDPWTNKETSVDIPAANVLFCAEYERFGQVRGLSRFYPVINKILDRGEINRALTKGIKMREQIGYAIEQDSESTKTPSARDRGSSLVPEARPVEMVETANGIKIPLEQFFGGGERTALQPGQKFKIIESDHPNENVREHLSAIERDIAAALDWPVELLWKIDALGGANTRFIMADAQSKIEAEQQALVEQFLGPWFIAWVRDMIEGGFIEDVEGWELHTWLLPKRLTVDFGRDGKLYIEQYKRGQITMKSLYGFIGDEWQEEIDEYLDERQYIKDGLTSNGRNLTWGEAFPEIGNPAALDGSASNFNGGDGTGTSARLESIERQLEDMNAALERALDKPAARL